MDYSIILISNKPHKFENIANTIAPEKVHFFNGTGYETFSKLVNDAVRSSLTETVIIMSDKVLPTQEHIQKVLSLLDQGFGFVSLQRFGFFGFRKELFRQIGFFDERYLGGGWEDYDFSIRLVEANIASYITEELPYHEGASVWDRQRAHKHWVCKWSFWQFPDNHPIKIVRNMPEPNYHYDLGPSTGVKFLPSNGHSHVTPVFIYPYFTMYFDKEQTTDYSIFYLADSIDAYRAAQAKVHSERLWYYKTYEESSLSKIINNCVEQSSNENVILFTEFVTPTQEQIQKIAALLREGYGFVSMQGFAFFGIKKELLRRIGMFDERYIPSGQESDDFINRMTEAGYKFYLTDELKPIHNFGDWLNAQHRWNSYCEFHNKKWVQRDENGKIFVNRMIEEEKTNYFLGPAVNDKLLRTDTYAIMSNNNNIFVKVNNV
jgi:GT2 family glycosyltransferase